MTTSLSSTESEIFTVLGNFLTTVLPTGTEIVQGQDNRVPEPKSANFVEMTALRRQRIATNVDSTSDAKFIGSIDADVMTITAVDAGAIAIGRNVFGVGVAANTVVTKFGTGTGGIGDYTVSPAQVVSERVLSAGTDNLLQPTRIVIQIDVHGPQSADNAQIISTLMRDDYAVRFFSRSSTAITPLYADDPRQMAFNNAAQQYEDRWIVEAHLQANIVADVPQEFADTATVGVIDVDAVYPP